MLDEFDTIEIEADERDTGPTDPRESIFSDLMPRGKRPYPLTHPKGEEAGELIRRFHAGDQKAKTEMVERNLALVTKTVIKFARPRGLFPNDPDTCRNLFQEGYFGLVRAMEKFDPDKGFAFSTYASHWIHQSVSRAYENTIRRTVRRPVHVERNCAKLSKIIYKHFQGEAFQRERGWLAEVARLFYERYGRLNNVDNTENREEEGGFDWAKLSKEEKTKRVVEMEDFYHNIYFGCASGDMSLNVVKTHGSEQNGKEDEWQDMLESDDAEIDAGMLDDENRRILGDAIGNIKNANHRILLRRRMVAGETLEGVGAELGLTRERIRQIQVQALNKVKYYLTTPDAVVLTKLQNPNLFFDETFEDHATACEVVTASEIMEKQPQKRQEPTEEVSEAVVVGQGNAKEVVVGQEESKEPEIKTLKGTPVYLVPPASASKHMMELHFRSMRSRANWEQLAVELEQEIRDVAFSNPPPKREGRSLTCEQLYDLLSRHLLKGQTQHQIIQETDFSQATVSRYLKRWRKYKGVEPYSEDDKVAVPFKAPDGYRNDAILVEVAKREVDTFSKVSPAAKADALDFASKNPELIANFENLSRVKADGEHFSPHHQAVIALANEGVSKARIAAISGLCVQYVYGIMCKYNRLVKHGIIKPNKS